MGELYNTGNLLKHRRALRRNQTPSERILWSQLRNRRLRGLKFYRQYSVGNYIVDFYCPSKKLAIEVDGETHMEPEEIEYDRRKTEYLNRVDIRVIRFWNEEVTGDCEKVVERICVEAGVSSASSPSGIGPA